MVLPVCDQVYSIVRKAVISLSLLINCVLFSLLTVGLSLALYFALCWFSPVSVLFALLQYLHFKVHSTGNLTDVIGYNGKVWLLGRVLFDYIPQKIP